MCYKGREDMRADVGGRPYAPDVYSQLQSDTPRVALHRHIHCMSLSTRTGLIKRAEGNEPLAR